MELVKISKNSLKKVTEEFFNASPNKRAEIGLKVFEYFCVRFDQMSNIQDQAITQQIDSYRKDAELLRNMALDPNSNKDEQKEYIMHVIDLDNKTNELVKTRVILKSVDKALITLGVLGVLKFISDSLRK